MDTATGQFEKGHRSKTPSTIIGPNATPTLESLSTRKLMVPPSRASGRKSNPNKKGDQTNGSFTSKER